MPPLLPTGPPQPAPPPDACLELHSHKTNKRVVLDELKRTLAMGRSKVERGTGDGVLLEEARDRLNDYASAVNPGVTSGLGIGRSYLSYQ